VKKNYAINNHLGKNISPSLFLKYIILFIFYNIILLHMKGNTIR